MVVLPKSCQDVGEALSSAHAREKAENRRVLLKIFQSVKFLGCQGLSLRGHNDTESNFMQLLELRKLDDPGLAKWFERKVDKYCSPEIQNEILQLMSMSLLQIIAKSLHSADFFTVMADECTDVGNEEQLTVCFRWVESSLEVHEEFVGLYQISDISSKTIYDALHDCILRLNLRWSRCRGQCFDGASNMSGHKNGVAAKITAEEPLALFTHCYGHALNLAMGDAIKACTIVRDAMDVRF